MAQAASSPLPATSKPVAACADYNLRIVWPIARYIEEHSGHEGLQALAVAGGRESSAFDGTSRWVSAESFEAVLARARSLVASEDEFMRACVHRIREAYGPLRYVLWATSPAGVFAQAASQYRLVSTCGDLVLVQSGPTSTHCHFTSRVPFTRLACLARQAQGAALPTFWGLPPAYVKEAACVGRGDPSCELDYHWYARRRWLPTLLGAMAAVLCGWALSKCGVASVPTPLMLGVLGAGLGYLFEVRRTERVNERTREEVMGALRDLAHDESDARRELLGMHQRQKDWTRLVEEEMTARTEAIQAAVSGVQEVHSARASTLLGFSHDLRNPLQIIRMAVDYLRDSPAVAADTEAIDSLGDMNLAIERMGRMLGDLVRVTQGQREFVPLAPQVVQVTGLTEGLRRRIRALVHGRGIRATVVATREAPETLEIDPLALDRILDNLLTNAAKYTERGGIRVELDGRPGYLVLKVSDTGCGIPPESLGRIFEPGGSSPRSRRGDSFGVGLSVVVQLLDQIGGRLEVMSRPGAGTTFCVYLPLVAHLEGDSTRTSRRPASLERSPVERGALPARGAAGRVVTIRHLPA